MKPHQSLRWSSTSLLILMLVGCTTNKDDLLPHGDQTILDIWNGSATGASQQQLLDARSALKRPVASPEALASDQIGYTRTAENEINNLFPRLPNPDLVLYVYPHLSGSEQAPVPGYSTVFPLYRTVQYAQPGERLDNL